MVAEGLKAHEHMVRACSDDIERTTARMAKARAQAEEYRHALEVLENE